MRAGHRRLRAVSGDPVSVALDGGVTGWCERGSIGGAGRAGAAPHRLRVVTARPQPLSYRRNGMSIFVLLLYSGYAWGKVATRFRSSTIPQ